MTVGVTLSSTTFAGTNAVDVLATQTREAASLGVGSVWFAQLTEHDALMAAAIAGREAPGIQVGTSVVPIYPRHPITLASQAQTAQAASHGRFTLGIGMSSRMFTETMYGTPWLPPADHLREYLTALNSLLRNGSVDLQGKTLTAKTIFGHAVPGASPVPVLVAAMGPRILRVAGELAEGTIPYLATPKVIADYVVPTISEAAGGRRPRIVVIAPVGVTGDPDSLRAKAQREMASLNQMPSYRTILDRGGVTNAADVAVYGDEETVAAEINRYFDAGATEVVVGNMTILSEEERLRTVRLAGDLTRAAR